mgnify:CR=1 FL=1
MEGKASRKVKDGKLVRVEAVYNEVFDEVRITGDFFLQPPEALNELEKSIEGMEVESSERDFIEALQDVEAELVGFSREEIAECVMEVVDDV